MRTYREYIYNLCNEADLSNEDEATLLVKVLAKDCLQYHDLAMAQEKKLQEIMSYKDFTDWSTEQAKEYFKNEVNGMEDGEFKDFCLENIGVILEAEE